MKNIDSKIQSSNIDSKVGLKFDADGRSLQLRPSIFHVFNMISCKIIFIRKPYYDIALIGIAIIIALTLPKFSGKIETVQWCQKSVDINSTNARFAQN